MTKGGALGIMGIVDPPRAKRRPDGERKEIRMKRAVCLFFAILLAFSFTGCVFTPSHAYPAATFARDGLTLTLTEAFSFADPAPEGALFALESTQVGIFVLKETFEELGMEPDVRSYVELVREANLDKDPTDVTWDRVRLPDGNGESETVRAYYFIYTTEDDHTFFVSGVVGSDACYCLQFFTRTSTFQTYRSHLAEWAAKAKAE